MASLQEKGIGIAGAAAENAIPILLVFTIIYTLTLTIQRLYLSPVSSFPGPKFAALTMWYEFYYDIFPHYGQYAYKINSLHMKYGPIIRINPYELHVSDPDFYETLYSTNKTRDKWSWMTRAFGMPTSSFATADHALHRVRRAALNPFFSIASVRKLEPVIQQGVSACLERLRGLKDTGKVINVVLVTSAFNSDVVRMYCFGRSQKRLEMSDFGEELYETGHQGGLLGPTIKHNIWILRIIESLPDFIVEKLGPALAAFVQLKQETNRQVIDIVNETNTLKKDHHHPTIFHELINSKLPDQEKSIDRLTDEALSIVAAGEETISWALTVAIYHILANPTILLALKTELKKAIPDPTVQATASIVEQLPYLRGVVKESLRLSYGVCSRLQRTPAEPLLFQAPGKEWTIPPGTPVSMTSLLLHHNETSFPDSHTFAPTRWLNNAPLDRYLVAFSKGSRQCVGQTLANAEMHLLLAAVFRRYGSEEVRFDDDEGLIELVEGDVRDVVAVADRFIPAVRADSKGVRIRISSL